MTCNKTCNILIHFVVRQHSCNQDWGPTDTEALGHTDHYDTPVNKTENQQKENKDLPSHRIVPAHSVAMSQMINSINSK